MALSSASSEGYPSLSGVYAKPTSTITRIYSLIKQLGVDLISHRKFSSTVAALAMVSTSLMMAAPAHAATIPVTASCPVDRFEYSANNFTAEVGDFITVENSDAATGMRVVASDGVKIIAGGAGNEEIPPQRQSKSYEVDSASGGYIEFRDNGIGAGPCNPVAAPTRITFTAVAVAVADRPATQYRRRRFSNCR
jgi:hypothetical protein